MQYLGYSQMAQLVLIDDSQTTSLGPVPDADQALDVQYPNHIG
jgi:hypothetical protein